MLVSGNINLRVGTNDPKTWQLLKVDGVTPISLVGITIADIVFVNENDYSDTKTFKTTDNPQKLVIDDAANGIVKFSPAVDDFTTEGIYKFYLAFTVPGGKRSVPEEKEHTLKVRPSYV